MKKNKNSNGKELRKPISDNFAPKRLAISFDPPMLIMEYLVIDTGKLYHHKMRLDSVLRKQKATRQNVLNYIKTKHYLYFVSGKVKDSQLYKFIDKILIRKGLASKNEVTVSHEAKTQFNLEPSQSRDDNGDDDFDYLNDEEDEYYEEDFNDYQDPSNFVNGTQAPIKKEQEKAQKNTFLTYCQEYEDEEEGSEAQASWDLDMDQNADFV